MSEERTINGVRENAEYVWIITTAFVGPTSEDISYSMSIVADPRPPNGKVECFYLGDVVFEKDKSLGVRFWKEGMPEPEIRMITNPIYTEDISKFCVATLTDRMCIGDDVEQFMQDIEDAIVECPLILQDSFEAIKKHKKIQEILWRFY